MPAYRFFVVDRFENIGQQIVLSEDEKRHIHVMRLKIGDSLTFINGQNALAEAILVEDTKEKSVVTLKKISTFEKPKREIHLLLGNCHPSRLDFTLEKSVELGISSLTLFSLEQSEVKNISQNRLVRLHRIMIAALKQSGRLFLPKIAFENDLFSYKIPNNTFFADPKTSPDQTLSKYINQAMTIVHLFIGPEGGFSEQEIHFLEKHHAKSFSLGEYILRADTAAIAALAQLELLFTMG